MQPGVVKRRPYLATVGALLDDARCLPLRYNRGISALKAAVLRDLGDRLKHDTPTRLFILLNAFVTKDYSLFETIPNDPGRLRRPSLPLP